MAGERAGRSGARGARRVLAALLAGMLSLALTACGLTIPTDPDGTLDRVSGGLLRVGASPSAGLIAEDDGRMSGPLAALVGSFASAIDADLEWFTGSEEELVADLEAGRIDLAVGGMTDATPWTDRVGATRGYPGIPAASGRAIVMLVPLGENALLSALERHLDAEVGS
jgi:ABC-type amino acid transport substrate-binding protein